MEIKDVFQSQNITRFGNSESHRRTGLVHTCGMELDKSIPYAYSYIGLYCHRCGFFAQLTEVREMTDSERCPY